jgi:hypothetical protein
MVKKLLIWMDNMVAWMATEGELKMVISMFNSPSVAIDGDHLQLLPSSVLPW